MTPNKPVVETTGRTSVLPRRWRRSVRLSLEQLEQHEAAGSLLNPLLPDPFLGLVSVALDARPALSKPTPNAVTETTSPAARRSPWLGLDADEVVMLGTPASGPVGRETPGARGDLFPSSSPGGSGVASALGSFGERAQAGSSGATSKPSLGGADLGPGAPPRGSDKGGGGTIVPYGPTNNNPPDAVLDDVLVDEDDDVTFDPLENDTDPDGDAPLTILAIGAASNGVAVLNGDGTVTYTPTGNYNGPDEFTYLVSDGYGGQSTGTVAVYVSPVNDTPVANNDAVTVAEDVDLVNIDVVANDTDIDGRMKVIVGYTQPANGYAFDNGDGTIRYIPNGDFNGTDTFQYTVWDGFNAEATATVTVTVTAVNDAPAAFNDYVGTSDAPTPPPPGSAHANLLLNDIDYDLDDAGYNPASLQVVPQVASFPFATYTVSANGDVVISGVVEDVWGAGSFTYTVTDGFFSTTATVCVQVSDANPVLSEPFPPPVVVPPPPLPPPGCCSMVKPPSRQPKSMVPA